MNSNSSYEINYFGFHSQWYREILEKHLFFNNVFSEIVVIAISIGKFRMINLQV